MRRYHRWMMALGIAAATPGLVQAGPLPFFKSKSSPPASQEAAAPRGKSPNQQVAEDIARALRAAKLNGYNIEVQYQNGVAILSGSVSKPEQRAAANRVVEQVPGVQRVENRLAVTGGESAAAQRPAARPTQRSIQQVQFEGESYAAADLSAAPFASEGSANQQMAESIAGALQAARFSGYDIEIQYQNGIAFLGGMVTSPDQKQAATNIVSQVPGVQQVNNQLQVMPAPQAGGQMAQAPIYPAAHQAPPAGMPTYASPPPGPAGFVPPAGPVPGYGHPGTGAAHTVYDMPNLPNHAWPTYAQYPNYAAVTYPSQYSASAWPYIGPFYPYPQVPLGWRQAQLEWDDGYWNLNFRPRTDRWWWFLDYRNW